MWHRDIREDVHIVYHDPVRSHGTDLDPIFKNLALMIDTNGKNKWLMDMGAFQTISSINIAHLYSAFKSTTEQGGALAMYNVQPFCEKVFAAIKMANVVPFYKSQEKALGYLQKK